MSTSKISPKGRMEIEEIAKIREEIREISLDKKYSEFEINVKISEVNQILNELKTIKRNSAKKNRYVMKNLIIRK